MIRRSAASGRDEGLPLCQSPGGPSVGGAIRGGGSGGAVYPRREEAGEGDSTRGGPTREGYSTREGGVSDTRKRSITKKRRVSQRREEYYKKE